MKNRIRIIFVKINKIIRINCIKEEIPEAPPVTEEVVN